MSSLVSVTPKLTKLIPLLGSDQPGEVVAAATAIHRTLQSAGCDFHDLVAVIEKPSPADERSRQDFDSGLEVDPLEMAEFCWRHPAMLNEREEQFIDKMRRYLARGYYISEKQARWLEIIYKKLRKWGA